MIHALGTRLAILKMESVCDRADAKFQQGFELGFEEAFDFMREFGHSKEVLLRLDVKEKIKKADEHAKVTVEQMSATDEKIHDIPSFAGPHSDAEKIEQNLKTLMDDAGVPDLRAHQTETVDKSVADWPDTANKESALSPAEIEEYQVGVFVRTWLLNRCPEVLASSRFSDSKDFDKTELSKLGLNQSDYRDLMDETFDKFGAKGNCCLDHMEFLHTIGDLVQYYKKFTLRRS
jgi:hypothetical protein